MTAFKYTAVSKSGVQINGVIRARDETEAIIQLKEKCSVVTSLAPVTDNSDLLAKFRTDKISDKTLSLVCKQFAIILSGGLPIVHTVELVAGQTEDKNMKRILTTVAEDITAGFSMADSFQIRAPHLPATFIESIRAGEESGGLDVAFARLSKYYSTKSRLNGKIVTALTYPAFVICVAVVVIFIIMTYAVPKFTETFDTLGADLPGVTVALIAFSNFCRHWGWLVGLLVVAAIIALRLYGRTENGKINLAEFKLKLPVIGRIQKMNAASQFANTLSTMIASGMPAMNALAVTGRAMSNAFYGSRVQSAVERVEAGYRISDSLRKEVPFPDLLTEMTGVGEESGSLEETLSVVGEYFDNEVEEATSKAVSMLEPCIIVVLAFFVMWVLLAVYLPMFSMFDTIT